MAQRELSTFERLQRGQKLNRKQRREGERRLNAADPGLEIVNRDAAGMDVGNESHYVAVPPGRDEQPVREFGSWTAALEDMAQWLLACRIRAVALQSTGVYWMALYDVLQRYGLEVNLVDARGTKNVLGRKLHTYGLLRACFLPSPQIHQVRTVWRLRDQNVKEAGREIQHMQKALIEMNVQLHIAISDLSGVTGQAIIRAILAGERDPHALAGLRDCRIQASEERSPIACRVTGKRTSYLNCSRQSRPTIFTAGKWWNATDGYSSTWPPCRAPKWPRPTPQRQIQWRTAKPAASASSKATSRPMIWNRN